MLSRSTTNDLVSVASVMVLLTGFIQHMRSPAVQLLWFMSMLGTLGYIALSYLKWVKKVRGHVTRQDERSLSHVEIPIRKLSKGSKEEADSLCSWHDFFDHQWMSWPDFLWGQFFMQPNANWLMVMGVGILCFRRLTSNFVFTDEQIRAKVVDFILGSCMAINVKELIEIDKIMEVWQATFEYPGPIIVRSEGVFFKKMLKVVIKIDLKSKAKTLINAFLDDVEVTHPRDILVLVLGYGLVTHSQMHSHANWAINLKHPDEIVRRSSLVTALMNFYGNTENWFGAYGLAPASGQNLSCLQSTCKVSHNPFFLLLQTVMSDLLSRKDVQEADEN